MDVVRYNQSGQKEMVQVTMPKLAIQPTLVAQIVIAEAANARAPHANTKTRAEVRGGGRKPWRQKGTGRARASSIRSPLWVGGGITFGPRSNRNFSKRANRQMRRRAFAMTLLSQIEAGRLAIVASDALASDKTKEVVRYMRHIDSLGRRPLVILERPTESIRGLRNLSGLRIGTADSVTTTEVLAATKLLVTPDSLQLLGKRAFGTELMTSAPATKTTIEKTVTKENK